MATKGTNRAAESDRAESKHGSIRRNAFATVLVLVAVLPLAIFALTYSLNKASADRMLDQRLLRSAQNAYRLRREVERALAMAEDLGYVTVQPAYRPMPDGAATALYETYVTPAFKETLGEIEPGDEMLDSATLLDARGTVIAWFGEGGEFPRQGHIQEKPDDTPRIVAHSVKHAAARGSNPVITVAFPTRIGEHIAGTLVIGLSFKRIDREIREQMSENNLRALRISVAGSVLLAVLGAYLLKLNDKARRLQSALEQRKHLAYIGTISAGLAHEIRNPLSSMKMNVQMIRSGLGKLPVDDAQSLVRKLDRVSGETGRLEQAMNDFLVFAAPRPLNTQPSDVNALADSVVEMLRSAEKNSVIVTRYASNVPPARIDQDMFVQMLRNLMMNALQAAGEGGTVEIETWGEKNAVAIAVSDSGPGVPEDQREKVFAVFYTTKKGGTGLGLNIAKRIAEDHGGSIALESSSLGGARFIVRLPLSTTR